MKRVLCTALLVFGWFSIAHADTTSLARLLQTGQTVSCTFTSNDGTSGNVSMASDKMRADMVKAGQTTHILRDGQFQYVWGGELGQMGIKMPVSRADAQTSHHHGPDLDAEADYSCKPWSADASAFVPPADVQFHDMGMMMNMSSAMGVQAAAGTMPEGVPNMRCAACDQAPADEQAACRQMMGC